MISSLYNSLILHLFFLFVMNDVRLAFYRNELICARDPRIKAEEGLHFNRARRGVEKEEKRSRIVQDEQSMTALYSRILALPSSRLVSPRLVPNTIILFRATYEAKLVMGYHEADLSLESTGPRTRRYKCQMN